MYNLLISIGAGILTLVAFGFMFGSGSFNPLYGIVPGLFAAIGLYVFLARRTMLKVQAIMENAQAKLQSAAKATPNNPKAALKSINSTVTILEEAYAYDKWQFLVKSQVDGQIGQLYFMAEKFNKALPYLQNSIKRNWIARAMLGVIHYKRKEHEQMIAVFDEAVEANKKESLLWNLYAYCLSQIKKREEAIRVLNRAIEHVGSDEKTKNNLKALQNNKKMKMRGWNLMWYQFHLDKPPAQRQPMHFRRR